MAEPGQGNLFDLPLSTATEQFDTLLTRPGCRLERIVSHGQGSPPDFWYDQSWEEWVVVLQGRAAVRFEGEAAPRELCPGDWLTIPAGCRHRVEWTDPEAPTVWLALHLGELTPP